MSGVTIREYLKSLNAEPLLFQPNAGNAGDAIVAHATFQLLHKLGTSFSLFDRRGYRAGQSTLIYGGGGNLTFYDHARKFLHKYHRGAKKLVLLPQTICGHESLLGEMQGNVDIICREEVSFDHVRRHARKANVLLMDDVAFNLDVKETLAADMDGLRGRALLAGSLLPTSWRHSRGLLLSLLTGRDRKEPAAGTAGALHCFRTDREKSGISIPRDNIDISARFAYGTHSEPVCRYTSALLLRFIDRFEEIRTNRLHIAIAGALLGKKVQFHSNSYYKCQAVYDYSMKDRFPNVEWMG